jgi:hypothetical protein
MRVRVMRRTQTHGRRSWPCPCLIVIQIHPFLRVLVLSYPCLVPLEHPGVISQLSESEGSASGGNGVRRMEGRKSELTCLANSDDFACGLVSK